jgi:hypothetical protein
VEFYATTPFRQPLFIKIDYQFEAPMEFRSPMVIGIDVNIELLLVGVVVGPPIGVLRIISDVRDSSYLG